MNRAGREPAEDVKRRIVHACQASGLKVAAARMYLRKNEAARLILVGASPADWTCRHPMISVSTVVRMNGDWSKTVDVRCSASDDEPIVGFWDSLFMQGRHAVPFCRLVQELLQTLEEREQVVAAKKLGVAGPFVFDDARWESPASLI